ncbi:hypothetical protein ASPCAL15015 [Aspergillus calidoustus]|uniref:Heterokaryon incompatibility domain-containing protein n=1 Tax=Aspergillus calidoustus TaxID=454130 RepID=A0A0U5GHJ5_ASPCI|nr:hypothetical protein ASPCAL15015 [Aspergillus calidoustus]
MDNILPLSIPHYQLEVPFFGHDVYDNLGFITYPNRRGWDPRHLRDGNYGERSSIDAASFAQAWLFFGTISEVTGVPVRGTGFIDVSEPDGRLLVTTQHLPFYLEIWRAKATRASSTARQKRETREQAKMCLDFLITWIPPVLLVPEHPEVAVSIEILLVTLVNSFKEIYGLETWEVPSAITENKEERVPLPGNNQGIHKYLKARMVAQGWCPYRLESFAYGLPNDALYTLSLMGTSDLRSGHDNCNEDVCVGNYVDDKTYNETPRHAREGCKCGFVRADVEKAISIIEQGQIPIATVNIDSEKQVCLEITPYKPGMIYIAISHVWAHGLGNPDENALRSCQLLELDKLLKRTHEDQNIRDTSTDIKTIYFWIDTLCLPVRPPHCRKAGIKQMRSCYEAAAAVLVLDKHLRRCTIYSPTVTTELLLQIAISDWRFRVWTLQEAIFAKNLIFQFLDGPVDAEELIIAHYSSPACDNFTHINMFLQTNILVALGLDPLAESKKLRVQHYSLLTLFLSLQGRATSKQEDEPVCSASLLGQDNVLDAVLECRTEDRMKEFWRTQGSIPAWVPFLDGPKIEETGYRWAPSTLRSQLRSLTGTPILPDYFFESTESATGSKIRALLNNADVPQELAEFVPGGPWLRITKPGFLLLKQREDNSTLVGPMDDAFRITDDRGHRYNVVRSIGNFNPELPALGGDIAIIVSSFPKFYHPQVLVVSVIKQGLDQGQESDCIRCRVRCRGTLIVGETFPGWLSTTDSTISYSARRMGEDQTWLLE